MINKKQTVSCMARLHKAELTNDKAGLDANQFHCWVCYKRLLNEKAWYQCTDRCPLFQSCVCLECAEKKDWLKSCSDGYKHPMKEELTKEEPADKEAKCFQCLETVKKEEFYDCAV